jgi:hypothetical protein
MGRVWICGKGGKRRDEDDIIVVWVLNGFYILRLKG